MTVPTPLAFGALGAVAVALFAIRLTGLPNLLDNEYRVGACVLDAVLDGNWISPHDSLGNVDKPPMLTWLSALVTLVSGHVTPFTLYLPGAVATLALACLVFTTGRRYFGSLAGFLGAYTYLLSDAGAHQIASARWDGLFALTVTIAALAALRAWMTGRGWTSFWLAAALSTLTKGPLGVILAALGLVASLWERRSGRPAPIEGRQSPGVLLYLLVTLGWFGLAYWKVGWHLIDDMVVQELFGHAVEHAPFRHFYVPPGDYLSTTAPWSLFACLGLVRICVAPAADDECRRVERFLFCWFTGGLFLFSVAPHSASRLLYPLFPAAAVIAGREMSRWAGTRTPRALTLAAAAVGVVALGLFALQYHRLERKNPKVEGTLAIGRVARAVHAAVGDDFPLTYVDAPFALQLVFESLRPSVSFAEAAALLRGDSAAFVVVDDLDKLRRTLGAYPPPLHELERDGAGEAPSLRIIGNRPRLEWTAPIATIVRGVHIRMEGVYLTRVLDRELVFGHGDRGVVTLVNEGAAPQDVRIRTQGGTSAPQARRLGPGEVWTIQVGADPRS